MVYIPIPPLASLKQKYQGTVPSPGAVSQSCFSNRFSALSLLTILVCFITSPLSAWVFAPERPSFQGISDLASGTFLVLDPDQWSRQEILSMRKQGVIPIARLDIAHREQGKTLALLIDEKWLVLPKYSTPPDPAPARFYLTAWQRLLLGRVDQIMHTGFAGLAIEGSSAAEAITDHPAIQREMQNWVGKVARQVKSLGMAPGYVFLTHEAGVIPLPDSADNLDGIIVPGIWYSPTGRNRHPWERSEPLKRLSSWVAQGKKVLTRDFPPSSRELQRVADEARSAGFDACLDHPKGEHR